PRYERHARHSRRACFVFRSSRLPVEGHKGPCHIRYRNKSQVTASQGLRLGRAEVVHNNWVVSRRISKYVQVLRNNLDPCGARRCPKKERSGQEHAPLPPPALASVLR